MTYSDTPPSNSDVQNSAVDVTPATGQGNASPAQRGPVRPPQTGTVRIVTRRAPAPLVSGRSSDAPPEPPAPAPAPSVAPPSATSADAAAQREVQRREEVRRQELIRKSQAAAASAARPPLTSKAAQAPARSPEPADEVAVMGIMLAACEKAYPGFAGRRSPAFVTFRQRYEPRISVIEKEPQYAEQLQRIMQATPQGAQAEGALRPGERRECDGMLVELTTALDAERRSEHFKTPESTWEYFIASLRAGDKAAVRACLAGPELVNFSPVLDKLDAHMMRGFADSFEQLRLKEDYGELRSYEAAMKGQRDPRVGHQVDFEKTPQGWRITSV